LLCDSYKEECKDNDNSTEEDEIDLEHFSIMRHSGRELMEKGKNIGKPFPAYAWDYLLDTTLITMNDSKKFKENVLLMYVRAMDDAGDPDFLPSILEVSDSIDEWNMIVIYNFYKSNGYADDEIDIILGNYIQEFSCLMEDWVEEVLRNLGYPYSGASVVRSRELNDEYAPQNILLPEFLR
jgi:hypothetical protein